MENITKLDISYFGEFKDKKLETEFVSYDMKRNTRFIGPITIIFGIIYLLFAFFDYFELSAFHSFLYVLLARILVLSMSASIYLYSRKTGDHKNLVYIISAFEITAISAFLVILRQYDSITYLACFSLMTMILVIYIVPNRQLYSLLMSIMLLLSFFLVAGWRIDGIRPHDMLKIVLYNVLLVAFCNLWSYLTNYYKRKQFIDSKELIRVSITDSLTGIYNRAKFNEELDRWIEACHTYCTPLSLVILDIDDFKKINDTYGHHAGDKVLKQISTTIKQHIRNTDIFARWGGEEFTVLLPNTELENALEMAERMRICVQNIQYENIGNVTCSFGLVSLKPGESAEALMIRADKLLYEAKNWGKNAVVSEAGRISFPESIVV